MSALADRIDREIFGYRDEMTDAVHYLLTEAAAELRKGEWISVKDRTPPEDTPVWCSINGAEPYFGTYSYADGDEDGSGWVWMRCDSQPYFHGGKWQCDDIEWDDQYDVTHWQPLPLPAPPALSAAGRREGE